MGKRVDGFLDTVYERRRLVAATAIGVPAIFAACFASGCGSSNEAGSSESVASTPAKSSKPFPVSRHAGKIILTFDALGGGSSVIEVFPGVKNIPADREYNGTYYSGDRQPAECKLKGRMVESDPSVGEIPRRSDEWILIQGTPGETQYAAATYTAHPQEILSQLHKC